MPLTVFPSIVFDAAGSDTAASGAGPTVALAGSAGNVTNASATATITDAVDLSGVAADGSAVLWINTASGRQFSRISAISGSSGAWSLTLEDSVWTTSTNVTWGIGGKRLSIDNANSRKLFTTDSKSGWTIQINSDQSIAGGVISLFSNGVGGLPILVTGNSTSPRPILTVTTNNAHFNFSNNNAFWKFTKLSFQCSSATRTSANGITSANNGNNISCVSCVFGDATNKLNRGVDYTGFGNNWFMELVDCDFVSCNSNPINSGSGSGSVKIQNCKIANNSAGAAVTAKSGVLMVTDSVIYANGGGLIVTANACNAITIKDNVVDGNTGNGIDLGSQNHICVTITGNNVTGNSGYGVVWTIANSDLLKSKIDYNCFGHASDADGPSNTSGAYNGLTAGSNDQVAVSPNYASRSGSPPNFVSGTNVKAKGFPGSDRTIGANTGGTTSYRDIGLQHQDAGGGGGLFTNSFSGGML